VYHKVDTTFLTGKYRFIIRTKQLPSCLCTETVRRASKTSTGDFQARGETVRERRRGPGRSRQRCRRVRAASVGSATSTCCAWRPTSSGTPPVQVCRLRPDPRRTMHVLRARRQDLLPTRLHQVRRPARKSFVSYSRNDVEMETERILAGKVAKYCDQHVRLSVCVAVCFFAPVS